MNKKTTLTIVQDFPKKQAEGSSASNMNLVQGKSSDVQFLSEGQKTTLTIVQDFPKKQAGSSRGIEMVQGKNTQIVNEGAQNESKNSTHTLVIAQDFAQQKALSFNASNSTLG